MMSLCSGRLIRTLANMKYRNYKMGTVEIVYNVISFVVAVAITVAFTVYARRALDELNRAEASNNSNMSGGTIEIEKLPHHNNQEHLLPPLCVLMYSINTAHNWPNVLLLILTRKRHDSVV